MDTTKLYIASLLAVRFTERGIRTSHTVTSCEATNEDEARQQLLSKAMELYREDEGYQGHDVALLEFGYNAYEEGIKV